MKKASWFTNLISGKRIPQFFLRRGRVNVSNRTIKEVVTSSHTLNAPFVSWTSTYSGITVVLLRSGVFFGSLAPRAHISVWIACRKLRTLPRDILFIQVHVSFTV